MIKFSRVSMVFLRALTIVGLFTSILIATYLGILGFTTPPIPYPYDIEWGIGFFVWYASIFALAQLDQGRWLIKAAILAFTIIILVTCILSHNLLSLLILIWLISLAAALGEKILQTLQIPSQESAIEYLAFSIGLGLTALSIITLATGALKILYPAVIYVLLLTLSTLLFPRYFRRLWPTVKQCFFSLRVKLLAKEHKLEAVAISIVLTTLVLSLISAIAPAVYADEVVYRLAIPSIYVNEHSWIEVPDTFASYYCRYPDLLYTLGLVLWDQPIPQFLHLTFSVLTGVLAFEMGRKIKSQRVGWLAAIIMGTTPLIVMLAKLAYVDLVLCFFVFGAIYALTQWLINDRTSYLILAGIFSGLAVGTKLNSAFFIFPLFVFFSIYTIKSKGLRRWLIASLFLILPALPFGLFWMITDWIWTGNPVFPFMNSFFRSPRWDVENTLFNYGLYGIGKSWLNFISLPWDLTVHASRFNEGTDSYAGALILLALPWNYLRLSAFETSKHKILYIWSGTILLSFILWFLVVQYLRYLLPLFPALSVLAATNLDIALDDLEKSRWQKVVPHVLLLILLAYTFSMHLSYTVSLWQIPEHYPLKLAFGKQTKQEFLHERLPEYDALHFLDTLGDGKHKVLALGNDVRLYTKSRIISLFEYLPETNNLRNLLWGQASWNWQDLYWSIRKGGFDYILVNQQGLRSINVYYRFEERILSPHFIDRFMKVEYAHNGFMIFRVPSPAEISQQPDSRYENLLANPNFETLNPLGYPIDWYWYPEGKLQPRVQGTYSGQVAILLDQSTPIYQEVEIISDNFYLLSVWSRSTKEGDFAWLTVNWLDEQKNAIKSDMWLARVYTSYNRSILIAKSPPQAKYASVVVSVAPGYQAWVDNIEFFHLK